MRDLQDAVSPWNQKQEDVCKALMGIECQGDWSTGSWPVGWQGFKVSIIFSSRIGALSDRCRAAQLLPFW